MKYFRLTEDRKTGHRPQFIDWYKDLESQKQDDVILFRIKEDSELIIPDILLIPMVMVNTRWVRQRRHTAMTMREGSPVTMRERENLTASTPTTMQDGSPPCACRWRRRRTEAFCTD